MRVISWTVVIGSIAAILYGGVRPLLQDVRLPVIDTSQVAGTATRPASSGNKNCAHPASPDSRLSKTGDQPTTCDESTKAKP